MKQRSEDEIWNYQQIDLGFNYRMNDIQAALGLNQIKRLDEYVKRRHQIAKYYDTEFKDLSLLTPWQAPNVYSSYHLYPVLIEVNSNCKTQKQVYDELKKNDISVNLHYTPVHRHPYYENLGFKKNDFSQAENFHRKAISIPMYAMLQDEQQKYVVETLRKVINS
jgi:dTDP-4-amino-4,6-dideoxygalactose transaminase